MMDRYIRRYGRRLYGLCLSLCANRSDAEDLYQDTWLKALRCIDKYDPEMAFEPWLTAICVNTYRNSLRRLARSPFRTFGSNEEKNAFFEHIPAPEGEDYTDLHAAIDALPEKLRLTVILFYFREMDVNETAAVLKVPAGTVKSRLSKARQKLREVLTNETDLRL